MQQVLLTIATTTGVREVHLLAHSMGSRIAAKVLETLGTASWIGAIQEVVLAAADIDAEAFRMRQAERIAEAASRLTLYASSGDQALAASKLLHSYPRVGEGGANLVILPYADTIDASPVDLDLLGHGYFAENKQVIDDLFMLLRHRSPLKIAI